MGTDHFNIIDEILQYIPYWNDSLANWMIFFNNLVTLAVLTALFSHERVALSFPLRGADAHWYELWYDEEIAPELDAEAAAHGYSLSHLTHAVIRRRLVRRILREEPGRLYKFRSPAWHYERASWSVAINAR